MACAVAVGVRMEIYMQIKVYENSLRAQRCREILSESRLASRFSEIIILPIPTTRDGIHLSGTDISLMDAIAYADHDTLVVGYGIPDEVSSVLSSFGATLCDVAQDEGFLLENAELTAVAALGILLNTEGCAPKDMRVGIVGFGRIGRSLFEKLLYLGARARVYTTRETVRRELAELGVESAVCPIVDGESLYGIDVLVNTAPARIFEGEDACAMPGDIRIIDLATGAELPSGVNAERYPSLPARMLPDSAGRAFAESVERLLLLGGYGEVRK